MLLNKLIYIYECMNPWCGTYIKISKIFYDDYIKVLAWIKENNLDIKPVDSDYYGMYKMIMEKKHGKPASYTFKIKHREDITLFKLKWC